MHILAISASPRRGGNSDVLCGEFLKAATTCRKFVWPKKNRALSGLLCLQRKPHLRAQR